MIRLRSESGRYKIYTIDIQEMPPPDDPTQDLADQLCAILTGQDACEGYEIVSVFPFRYEYVVILKA